MAEIKNGRLRLYGKVRTMSVSLCVWMLTLHGGTNRNCCAQGLVILHAQTYQ